MSCEIENYREVEIDMIKHFNPIFNVQHNRK
jgi:predicted nucleic-acid-binding Zn-ribbon protein